MVVPKIGAKLGFSPDYQKTNLLFLWLRTDKKALDLRAAVVLHWRFKALAFFKFQDRASCVILIWH